MESIFETFTRDLIETKKFEVFYEGKIGNSRVEKMVSHNEKVILAFINKDTGKGFMQYIQVIGVDASNPNVYENDYVVLEYFTEPGLSEFELTFMRISGEPLQQGEARLDKTCCAKLPSAEDGGSIAVGMSEHLNAKEQSFFVAGFQECIKYLTK